MLIKTPWKSAASLARRLPRDSGASPAAQKGTKRHELSSFARPRRGQTKTKGGIIIPDTAKEKPQEGEIIAVGPGGRDESGKLTPLDVKSGDKILFGKWSGTEVKIDGQDLLIMKESDILGVVA